MNPSTSLGTKSKGGMAKPSPSIRHAGSILSLLWLDQTFLGRVGRHGVKVNKKCRCRVKSLAHIRPTTLQFCCLLVPTLPLTPSQLCVCFFFNDTTTTE